MRRFHCCGSGWWRPALAVLAIILVWPASAFDESSSKPALGHATLESAAISAQSTCDLDAKLSALIKDAFEAQELVGLSVGIVRDGRVVRTIHHGFEDRAKGVATSDVTMYRWASISKPVTAITAMQLVEAGRLDLDRDVRRYVPEFPDKDRIITTRQLLCHQGGIVHYTNGPVIRMERTYDSPHPFEDVVLALDAFKESPLVADPGDEYAYTTHGYMLISAVVQRAGGEPFIEQVYRRITAPLGMNTLQPDYEWRRIPHRATGYYRTRDGEIRASRSDDVSWKLGGGGFISTVGDLAGFAAALSRRDSTLLKDATYDQMWTRQRTTKGDGTTYGLGFGVGRVPGMDLPMISHSGSQQKTRTQMVVSPTTGDAVVIMSNSEWANLGELARELLKTIVEDTRSRK